MITNEEVIEQLQKFAPISSYYLVGDAKRSSLMYIDDEGTACMLRISKPELAQACSHYLRTQGTRVFGSLSDMEETLPDCFNKPFPSHRYEFPPDFFDGHPEVKD